MPLRLSALLVLVLPLLSHAQFPCFSGETTLSRDSKGALSLQASQCHDVSVRAHFLGARGVFQTALTFQNPALALPLSCGLGKSCLKSTAECAAVQNNQGCRHDPLTDPGEISCACEPRVTRDFAQRVAAGQTEPLQPLFLIDQNGDGAVDNQRGDVWTKGGRAMRVYRLSPTLSRLELEDMNLPPAGDFNDYVAAVETQDCDPNRFWPPQTTDFGGPERPIVCVDRCKQTYCDPSLTAPKQPFRFSVALGIDDASTEADREWRGRKLHLTVSTHQDFAPWPANEAIAVCPVLWLDWRRPRDPKETSDLTQLLNYGAGSSCGTWTGYKPSGFPLCPRGDEELTLEALPISLSEFGGAQPCSATPKLSEWFTGESRSAGDCGPRTHVRDYELPLADVDARLVDPSLHYRTASSQELSDAVVAVELLVFRQLEAGLMGAGAYVPFACPSGVNARLRGAPPDVGVPTSYRFVPPSRPYATPGFTLYVRQ